MWSRYKTKTLNIDKDNIPGKTKYKKNNNVRLDDDAVSRDYRFKNRIDFKMFTVTSNVDDYASYTQSRRERKIKI